MMLTSGTTHKMNGNFHSLIKLIFVLSPNKALLGWICATFEGLSNSLNFILIAHCIKELRIRNKSIVKGMQMYFSYDCHTCFYVPFYLITLTVSVMCVLIIPIIFPHEILLHFDVFIMLLEGTIIQSP